MISRSILLFGAIMCFGSSVILWSFLGGIDTATPLTNTFVAIPTILGIALIIITRFRSDIRTITIICGVAVCGAVVLAEGAARMGLLHNDRYATMDKNIQSDPRSVGEVVADLNASGANAVPAVFPRGLYDGGDTGSVLGDILPLGGVADKTTVLCNETGKYLIYKSDELGFNNPKGIWSTPPINILVVGDSFSQGACVRPGESFVDHIRQRHPKTITLGMSGNGPLAMLASLKEYISALRPKIVIWAYYEENDLSEDLPDEIRVPMLTRYLEKNFTQNLYENREQINTTIIKWLENQVEAPLSTNRPPSTPPSVLGKVKNLLKLGQLRNQLNIQVGPSQSSITMFRRILSRAKEIVAEHDSHLVFLNLPGLRRYSGPVGRIFQNLRRERVLKIVLEENIPIIDAATALDTVDNPASMFLFHYTAKGNHIVGEHVLKALSENSLGQLQ